MTRVNTNPATGLPELPPGYFWRVVGRYIGNEFSSYHPVFVQLRKKYFIGSKVVEGAQSYGTPRAVYETAAYLVQTFNDKRDTKDSIVALLGDYPPKKLVVPEEVRYTYSKNARY